MNSYSKHIVFFIFLGFISACQKKKISLDKVKIVTESVTSISVSVYNKISAEANGIIVDHNSFVANLEYGVCISELHNPTINDEVFDYWEYKTIGKFKVDLDNLKPNTKYYVRAYVKYRASVKYGEEISFDTPEAYPNIIGDDFQGGILAYIYQPGDILYVEGEFHGLIAATTDQSAGIPWKGSIAIGSPAQTSLYIGSGSANTQAIASHYTSGSFAAKLCNDLILNGHDDWFLPSRDELYQIRNVHFQIGGFSSGYYWSSSAYNNYEAWDVNILGSSSMDTYYMDQPQRVRAVRSF